MISVYCSVKYLFWFFMMFFSSIICFICRSNSMLHWIRAISVWLIIFDSSIVYYSIFSISPWEASLSVSCMIFPLRSPLAEAESKLTWGRIDLSSECGTLVVFGGTTLLLRSTLTLSFRFEVKDLLFFSKNALGKDEFSYSRSLHPLKDRPNFFGTGFDGPR